MNRIFYNKLIRDKVPEKIKAIGSECETRKLSKNEFEKELLKKIKEEAEEIADAKDNEEMIGEIADLMDVVEEILKLKKISWQQIEEKQKANLEKKGGFDKKLFLVWSSDDGYGSNEKSEE